MTARKSTSSRKKPRRNGRKRGTTRRGRETSPLVTLVGLLALGITAAALGIGLASDDAGQAGASVEESMVANLAQEVRAARAEFEVEVLNGGGVSGMAGEVTDTLRRQGFDVVRFGNAATFDPDRPSQVIDRVGRADVAQDVAEALGIDNVLSDPDPNLYVDVTVVLGAEWTAQQISSPDDSEKRPSWDPRTWFGN
jgi:hypothetical protein